MNYTMRYVNDEGGEILFSMSSGFIITDPGSVSENNVEVSTAQGIGQVGASVQSQAVKPRSVTVTGFLRGNEAAKKEKLLSVVRPALGARLYFNDTYYLVVYPTVTPVLGRNRTFAAFQFSLLAPYPYWQLDQSTSTILSGLQPCFRFPWNLTVTWTFAEELATQFINVKNTGQLAVPFTVTFSAKDNVVNPKITNVITGEWLRVNRTLAASERVTVQITHDLTYTTSSVAGDIRGNLDIDGTLFRLGVGDNMLKPEAESGGTNLEVAIDHAIEVLGVAI